MRECRDIREKKLDEERLKKLNADPDAEEEVVKKPRGRTKKNPVYATTKAYFCTVNGIKVYTVVDNAVIAEWYKKEGEKINKMKYEAVLAKTNATIETIDWSRVSEKIVSFKYK